MPKKIQIDEKTVIKHSIRERQVDFDGFLNKKITNGVLSGGIKWRLDVFYDYSMFREKKIEVEASIGNEQSDGKKSEGDEEGKVEKVEEKVEEEEEEKEEKEEENEERKDKKEEKIEEEEEEEEDEEEEEVELRLFAFAKLTFDYSETKKFGIDDMYCNGFMSFYTKSADGERNIVNNILIDQSGLTGFNPGYMIETVEKLKENLPIYCYCDFSLKFEKETLPEEVTQRFGKGGYAKNIEIYAGSKLLLVRNSIYKSSKYFKRMYEEIDNPVIIIEETETITWKKFCKFLNEFYEFESHIPTSEDLDYFLEYGNIFETTILLRKIKNLLTKNCDLGVGDVLYLADKHGLNKVLEKYMKLITDLDHIRKITESAKYYQYSGALNTLILRKLSPLVL
ncbi:hypothetical protein CRE_08649 [Caenorhabditis remanei]|uniref:BTB domain-containing protein n=1 Tax=Caenorhabditis remanei TaxID=31234 RepID=E3LJ15_CAERE|nr:hypothetical protein CRE_08649 [Caenorhabditis remanei]